MIGRECGDMIGTAGPSSRCRTGPGPRSATPTATSSAAASGATAPGARSLGTRARPRARAPWRTAPEVRLLTSDNGVTSDNGCSGQCRDDKDCTPWAPSCSPLGYCRGGVQVSHITHQIASWDIMKQCKSLSLRFVLLTINVI